MWWSLEGAYLRVHDWLGETGLIDLVVTVVAIANHVDQDVLLELLPVFDHEFACFDYSFGVRCIHA